MNKTFKEDENPLKISAHIENFTKSDDTDDNDELERLRFEALNAKRNRTPKIAQNDHSNTNKKSIYYFNPYKGVYL